MMMHFSKYSMYIDLELVRLGARSNAVQRPALFPQGGGDVLVTVIMMSSVGRGNLSIEGEHAIPQPLCLRLG